MDFMTDGMQAWTALDDPYDEIIFPSEEGTATTSFKFFSSRQKTVEEIVATIDPGNSELKKKADVYLGTNCISAAD